MVKKKTKKKPKKVRAYHTDEETKVYHIYDGCTVGNNIEKRNIQGGAGGYRLCKKCKAIQRGR